MRILENLKNLKKNNKGFTLIEIVIVIVIIAILAAMLIPSMLSWIDSANQRTFLSASDTIRTSASTVLSENYAAGKANDALLTADDEEDLLALVGDPVVVVATDMPTTMAADTYYVKVTITSNKITAMQIDNNRYSVTWHSEAGGSGDSAYAAGWGEITVK